MVGLLHILLTAQCIHLILKRTSWRVNLAPDISGPLVYILSLWFYNAVGCSFVILFCIPNNFLVLLHSCPSDSLTE